MLRTSPGGQGKEQSFLAERAVLDKTETSVEVCGCSGIFMRLVCKMSYNQLFILNVNLWGKLAYGTISCQEY